jgi:C-3',4' desaturase CrtD
VKHVVVVGGGMGGLSAAAVLARAGLDVTVLEAHIYAGGCAGTFFHQGYRFDAGATLAAGFNPGGPMDVLAQAAGLAAWPVRRESLALTVHLPDGSSIPRPTDPARWKAERQALSPRGERFWDWQERTADAVWDFASRLPSWPPATLSEVFDVARSGIRWLSDLPAGASLPGLLLDAGLVAATHLPRNDPRLRLFVDGQLLISAQTTSAHANALYAAAALDLPRRGVVQVEGGMGALAQTLVESIRRNRGRVLYRQEAVGVRMKSGVPVAVETRRGESFPADVLILNLTPWDAAKLLGEAAPPRIRHLPLRPDGWGAFTVYAGVDGAIVPAEFPLHHQILTGEPLGEGRSVFLTISPAWDSSRAPAGRRALTFSTHTRLDPWWALEEDGPAFAAHEATYTDRLLSAAERLLPGLRRSADLVLPGTPVTFEKFTRRTAGWVGGFPQTDLFRSFAPRLAPRVWLAGDSIFPGQSVAATTLGGLRVAHLVLQSLGCRLEQSAAVPRLAGDAAR